MKKRLTPQEAYYKKATEFLKKVYGLEPNDMDYDMDTAYICMHNGEQPEDEIIRQADKYGLETLKEQEYFGGVIKSNKFK